MQRPRGASNKRKRPSEKRPTPEFRGKPLPWPLVLASFGHKHGHDPLAKNSTTSSAPILGLVFFGVGALYHDPSQTISIHKHKLICQHQCLYVTFPRGRGAIPEIAAGQRDFVRGRRPAVK